MARVPPPTLPLAALAGSLLAAPGTGAPPASPPMAAPAAPAAAASSAPPASGAPSAPPLFRDVTAESGIRFTHHADPEKKYIVESMAGGVALLDYDDDGLVDVYFVDSLTVETARDPRQARSALYRNLGGFRFEDVTERAGVGHPGWGMGVCVADVDGDGRQDLYVTALEANRLYRNNGDGTFTDIAPRARVAGGGWSAGCGFADYDRDGDLDLFVSRYIEIDLANLPAFGQGKTCQYRGIAVQCGPRGLPGEGDLLFRNEGDGTFTEVGAAAGVSDPREAFGLGLAWFDADEDGWLDLFVANDSSPNFLYMNQRNGSFKETAFAAGVAVSEDGGEQGCMGVAVGDYDGSGRLSLFVTNFAEEYNAFYRNEGTHFTDVSFRTRTAAVSLPYVGWGTQFLDYDNDGRLDLFVVNGHVYPQLEKTRMGAGAGYRQRKLLYHNRGDGTFEEVAARYGALLTQERVSRGSVAGDLDNDGRLDLVINDLDGPAQVLRNELAAAGGWLIVRLRGAGRNTGAIGATITVRAAGLPPQRRLVQSGTSYLSQDDQRQHFGLGAATRADLVEVRWPDGSVTRRENVEGGRVVEIRQER